MNPEGIRDSGFGIRDAGDSALLLELAPVIDPAVNRRAIAIARALSNERFAGVRDVIPTYRSVAVHFDPLIADVDQLRERMERLAEISPAPGEGRVVEVPVTYGGDDGPDLQDVAAFAKVSPEVVIERHCATEYRVFMLGFLPGFAYMGTVDPSIAAPRKATPRARIPAGSVGIAGGQTGIYPRQSPGGWQLIGRTSVSLFDPARAQPSLFAPGDRVRFVPVTGIRDSGLGIRGAQSTITQSQSPIPNPQSRSVTVLRPGLFTTIQDSGRWGHQDRGVPVSGPMDRIACRLANLLVGNRVEAAVLEATILGPELRFERPVVVAVTGADLSASVDGRALPINTTRACDAGSVLRFGERRAGARAYIACDGGFDVPLVLGSRSTHVLSALGGLDGRALKASDRIPLGEPQGMPQAVWREPVGAATLRAPLRMMRGPQGDSFDESAFDALQRTRFVVSPQSDRMGYRLVSSDPESRIPNPESRTPAGAMISDAAFIGGLQIPPSGNPILLMADRQTTGGYPQIATVITADLPLAGQLAPGDSVEFRFCSRSEAVAAFVAQEERLRGV